MLLNLGEPGGIDISPWAIESGWSTPRTMWELPVPGEINSFGVLTLKRAVSEEGSIRTFAR